MSSKVGLLQQIAKLIVCKSKRSSKAEEQKEKSKQKKWAKKKTVTCDYYTALLPT
jgi:hypothetical protein